MFLLEKFSFSVIIKLGASSAKLQINFGVLQIDTENSATGTLGMCKHIKERTPSDKRKSV